jgi:hypothetical protein
MKRSVFLLIIALWPAYYSYAQQIPPGMAEPKKALNIAVIADKTGGLDKSPLISLLEVQLSNNKNIKLVERAQIDKILQEQQLSATGLLERNNTIKIGQLLRADAFIILSLENQTEKVGDLIRVRLAQTAHGLRLLDYFEQIEVSKPDEVAQKIIKRLESVIVKLSLPVGAAVPVGIVDIHRVQLGDKYRILERSLPMLLSVSLGIEPKIIMLEREDLKILQDEKLRTSGEDFKFWGSGVLIEGNLQTKNGGLEMSLSLHRSGESSKSFSIPIDPNEPSVAIDKAATNIVQEILNTPPTGQWQLAAEAEQFYQEGQMLSAHSRYEDAINPTEIAYALQPNNIDYIANLFEVVWNVRYENEKILRRNEKAIEAAEKRKTNNPQGTFVSPKLEEQLICPYSDLDIAGLVSIWVRRIHNVYEKGQLSASFIDNYKKALSCLGTDLMDTTLYFVSPISVTTEQIKQINRENRRIWIETVIAYLKQQPIQGSDQQIKIFRDIAQLSWISTDDPNELIANIRKSFAEFIMPPEIGGKIASSEERASFCEQGFLFEMGQISQKNLEATHLKGVSNRFIELWNKYLTELAENEDELVSILGKRNMVYQIAYLPNETSKAQIRNFILKSIEIYVEKLTNPDKPLDTKTKQHIINNIGLLLFKFPGPLCASRESSPGSSVWERICEFFIGQKDIDCLIDLEKYSLTFMNERGFTPDKAQRSYQLLERIAEVFQTRKGDERISSALMKLRNTQALIRERVPRVEFTQSAQSLSVKMLLTKENLQKQGKIFLTTFTEDEILWLSMILGARGTGDSPSSIIWLNDIGLVGINLAQKKLTSIWQTSVKSNRPITEITGLLVGNKASYISLYNGGILEFPGNPREGQEYIENSKIYTQENGLPSLLITSIAQDGDKLWVAYGYWDQESGLGLFDPNTKKWETFFCSTLKGNPPFSDGQPYMIPSILSVNPDKLFLYGVFAKQQNLWRMDVKTKQLQFIHSIEEELTEDLAANSWLKKANPKSTTLSLKEDMFLTDSFLSKVTIGPYTYKAGTLDLSTGTIHNNKFWARLGQSQIIIAEKGKSFEEAEIIDNNILDGGPVFRFVSTPYGLIAIGEGTVGLIETEGTQK